MASPYQPPNIVTQQPKPVSYDGGGHPMQPLHGVAGWLNFLGWFNIVVGILYALSIVFIIIAWLPIWIGICLKNAGEALKAGYPNDSGQLYRASSNLATAIRIVGVLCIINIVFAVLNLCVIALIFVVGFAGAAGAAR